MKITFLGTAAAECIPAMFCRCETCRRAAKAGGKDLRLRASILVNEHQLIDMGPDINLQRLRYHLDLSRLEAVFYTHSHTDHLDPAELTKRSTADYCYIPVEEPLEVFGNQKVVEMIREGFQIEFLNPENPSVKPSLIRAGETVTRADVSYTALPCRHDPNENCLCYLVQDDHSAFLLANDTGFPDDSFFTILRKALNGRKLDAASMDCTFGCRDVAFDGHMDLGRNVKMKQRLQQEQMADLHTRFIATHFSHNCGQLHQELFNTMQPYGIEPAWDGLVLEL